MLTLDPAVDRGAVALGLRERGIGCNFGTYASHLQPVYGDQAPCPVSADLFARHLAVPMHANLTEDDVDHACRQLTEVLDAVAARP